MPSYATNRMLVTPAYSDYYKRADKTPLPPLPFKEYGFSTADTNGVSWITASLPFEWIQPEFPWFYYQGKNGLIAGATNLPGLYTSNQTGFKYAIIPAYWNDEASRTGNYSYTTGWPVQAIATQGPNIYPIWKLWKKAAYDKTQLTRFGYLLDAWTKTKPTSDFINVTAFLKNNPAVLAEWGSITQTGPATVTGLPADAGASNSPSSTATTWGFAGVGLTLVTWWFILRRFNSKTKRRKRK